MYTNDHCIPNCSLNKRNLKFDLKTRYLLVLKLKISSHLKSSKLFFMSPVNKKIKKKLNFLFLKYNLVKIWLNKIKIKIIDYFFLVTERLLDCLICFLVLLFKLDSLDLRLFDKKLSSSSISIVSVS